MFGPTVFQNMIFVFTKWRFTKVEVMKRKNGKMLNEEQVS